MNFENRLIFDENMKMTKCDALGKETQCVYGAIYLSILHIFEYIYD